MFRFLLRLKDDSPCYPPVLVTAVPNWAVGEVVSTGDGDRFRILAKPTLSKDLEELGFHGIFTVEPA